MPALFFILWRPLHLQIFFQSYGEFADGDGDKSFWILVPFDNSLRRFQPDLAPASAKMIIHLALSDSKQPR